MAQGFRIAGTLIEFLSDLDKLKGSEHDLIVWQNDLKGEKQIYNGVYHSYVLEKDNIIVNVTLPKN